ncbi:cytochrome c peroxidase [Singulisphaera acidiphila DSM 18658]|uniref:Cytochrome c peroxidase n=2 Tax=Singulisphaera acidiphila TaxID=466153 RepID=L0DEH8_SINAD|nr:cytochrome c peroxidase [Singulisphaera acidiphila DSM 18658]
MHAMIRGAGLGFGLLLSVLTTMTSVPGAERSEPANRVGPQVPVALLWGPDDRLHVALREARRLVTVDPQNWQVVADWPVPIRPCSLALDETGSTYFVGGADGETLVLDREGAVVRTLTAGKGPTRILPLPAGQVAVGSLWDAAVRVIDWRDGHVVATHRLPFPVGALARTPKGRVVVADAFGGHLADFVPGRPGSERVRNFEGVNLGAIAVSDEGKELLVIHMEQLEPAPITAANIDRGLILSSRLSGVQLSEFDSEADEPLSRRQVVLDGPVHGAADPSALALSPDGTQIFITLAGSHHLLKNDRTNGGLVAAGEPHGLRPLGHNQRLQVLEVGRSPVAVAFDRSGQLVVTADSMSDRISVVKVANLSRVASVELSSGPIARTPEQRGEALFLDGRRALDRWMSCSSCHNAGHTNGLNFDTMGDGGFGAPKNTPSLLGVAGTEPLAWNGSLARLADQVHQSLESSLRGPDPAPGMVDDLVAYLESLRPPPPRRPRDDPAAQRGAALFQARRCESCHRPPSYTIAGVRDVGLDDGSGGNRKFNPPSLRGVGWSAPYFHDGRAATLSQVVQSHSPGQERALSPQERDDLVAFLESL